jgi:hypothetical protein
MLQSLFLIEKFAKQLSIRPEPKSDEDPWALRAWKLLLGDLSASLKIQLSDLCLPHMWSASLDNFDRWIVPPALQKCRGWYSDSIKHMLLMARKLIAWPFLDDNEQFPSKLAVDCVESTRQIREEIEMRQSEIARLVNRGSKVSAATPKARAARTANATKRLRWVLERADQIGSSERSKLADSISSDYAIAHPGKTLSAGTIERMLAKHRPKRAK